MKTVISSGERVQIAKHFYTQRNIMCTERVKTIEKTRDVNMCKSHIPERKRVSSKARMQNMLGMLEKH